MPKRGIPAKYDYFHCVMPKLKEIENMITSGYPIKEIADFVGVPLSTYYKWKRTYTELEVLHASGKEKNVAKLKHNALREALGYETIETHTETIDSYLGQTTRTKTVKKWVRGSPQLIIFLLCNWAPEEFKRTDTEEILKSLQVFMSKEVKDVYGD